MTSQVKVPIMTLHKNVLFFTLFFCMLLSPAHSNKDNNNQIIDQIITSQKGIKKNTRFLIPHKAEYTVSLLKPAENIKNVTGTVTIRILDSFGWVLEYHVKLTILHDDNTEDFYESTLASFEDVDHKSYGFTLKTALNNEVMAMVRGKAVIDDEEATVTYKNQNDNNLDIAETTLFPIHLLKTWLQSAQDKPTVNTCDFFGYYNTEFTPLHMHTIICAKEPLINVKGITDIDFKKAYQMKIAIYPIGDEQIMDPISTLSKVIQADGITVSEELFFPEFDFTIKTQLSKVELYKPDPEDNFCSRSSAG